ncbi:three-helix bundle dimerization domain-containing protein [Streptacidiphilus sp. P02-A3a]|uniref:three-helix bundle dimerization domain-containing protein n=1 Tax=Streptacidiphilus sp. P02-A3a TaxID=2704468 RepID=UPI0015FA5C8D|nr:hypothetical protein [Streptacidiphilus sp. P02-A3a]QMU66817.1 hypothetical protein GXP74_19020 [Streptacidiphilus sp. P02-A3a]
MPAKQQEEMAVARVRERLHRRYDPVMAPAEVDRVLAGARRRFEGSKVRTFIPILVERRVRSTLDGRQPS